MTPINGIWSGRLRLRLLGALAGRTWLCLLLGLRLRLGLGLRLLRLARRPTVGLVEAAALERDADVAEDLAQPAPALGTLLQRLVAERLDDLEMLPAVLAGVLVGGHRRSLALEPGE